MTKWEYKIEDEKFDQYGESWLNKFGAEGWEIINVRPGHVGLEYTFKRPLVEDDKYPWHDFGDGVIPALDEQVEIKRRNGTTDTGKANLFRWNEWGNEYDIVAWRLNG